MSSSCRSCSPSGGPNGDAGEPGRPGDHIDDLVGTVNRAIHWMQHALDQQVQQRRATQEFAAAELERMTQVLHLLEDLRGAAAPQPDLHIAPDRRRRA
jgi:hypothetical protein